jgi:ferrochelatase
MDGKKTAVILFQLGGPDSLNAVEPFLYNLFCDPDIFDFPLAFLFRKPLARMISQMRARGVQHHYIVIGGKSPILELTRQQADALETELRKDIEAKVFVAMRYWHPKIDSVVENLKISNFDRFILLPLYPQYSKPTTASSINEWHRQCKKKKFNPPNVIVIKDFHQHPLYIEAIVDQINLTYNKFENIPSKEIHLVFSAHGVPESLIASGDPYKDQIEKTVSAVISKGNWDSQHTLCYQSKVGPMKWLTPSLNDTINKLAGVGNRHLLVVPISFVTEHIETLQEIDVQTRQKATELGVKQFEMMPALNSHPKFIAALKDLVIKVIEKK